MRRMQDWGRRSLVRLALPLALLAVSAGLPACSSRYKKLSRGGSASEILFYDVLDRDRPANEYYSLIRSSHREKDFCYECASGDPYLVDKNIDAVERLGRASYGRLEGLGEVVELFSEVIMEDRSALARSQAAISLTQIGLRLPEVPYVPIEDDGRQLLALMQEVDRLYGGGPGNAGGRCPSGARQVVIDRITRIGDLEFESIDFRFYRQGIRFFYGRPYLVDEQDPAVRQAIDAALTKRLRGLIQVSLRAAVDDASAQVRQDAVRGLKTLGDRGAVDLVTARLEIETHWLVRMEAAEYLGKVGTRRGVLALIPMLEDANASVRHKARVSLMRIAGADYGVRREGWEHWARQKDPSLTFDREASDGKDAATAALR